MLDIYIIIRYVLILASYLSIDVGGYPYLYPYYPYYYYGGRRDSYSIQEW